MNDTARLFVAVDLPDTVRRSLATWAGEVAGSSDDLRLVAPEGLHLTVIFLGDQPLVRVAEIDAAMSAAADGPVPLGLGDPLWLAPRRPHVLTVAVDDPAGALAALHRGVENALVGAGLHTRERRAFRPHVTVARVRRGAHVDAPELPAPDPARFSAEGLTLYRSRLGRSGAQYEALATVALPRPG